MLEDNELDIYKLLLIIRKDEVNKLAEICANQTNSQLHYNISYPCAQYSLLSFAILYQSVQCVQWLIEKKVNINHVPDGSICPLPLAIFALSLCGHKRLATILCTYFASENQQSLNLSAIQASITAYTEDLPAARRGDASIAIISALIHAEGIRFSAFTPIVLDGSAAVQEVTVELIHAGLDARFVQALQQQDIEQLDAILAILDDVAFPFSAFLDHFDTRISGSGGDTSLIVCIAQNKIRSVQWLLDHGADLNRASGEGIVPLCLAISLCAKKKDKMSINQTIFQCFMEELSSSSSKQVEKDIVNLLVQHPKIQLDVITSINKIKSELINRQLYNDGGGSDIMSIMRQMSKMYSVNPTDQIHFPVGKNLTPLMLAVHSGHEDLVMAMLAKIDNVAHLNTHSSTHGTVLSIALNMGMREVVKVLIKKGVDVKIKVSMTSGELSESLPTANTFDSIGSNDALSNRLLATSSMARARVCIPDVSSIILAAKAGMVDVVEYLRSLGHTLNEQCDMGITPLRIAAEYNREEMVAYILKHIHEDNVDINACCSTFYTPLLIALESQHKNVASMLIEAGADWTITNNPGHSPLGYVVQHGFAEIFDQMVARGLQSACQDHAGRSVLKVAILAKQDTMVRKLYQLGLSESQEFLQSTLSSYLMFTTLLLTNRLDQIIGDRLGSTPVDHHHRVLKCLLLDKLNQLVPAEEKCSLTDQSMVTFYPMQAVPLGEQSQDQKTENTPAASVTKKLVDGFILKFYASEKSNASVTEDRIEFDGMAFEKNMDLLQKIEAASLQLLNENADVQAMLADIDEKNQATNHGDRTPLVHASVFSSEHEHGASSNIPSV